MRTYLVLFLVSILLPTASALADSDHQMPPYKGSAELEMIKNLAGDWKGKVTHEGKEFKDQVSEAKETTVSYTVTSNGSAVIERIFQDTPMEMTSVYFDRDGKLAMTHYCAVANRPTLALQKKDKNSLTLSYESGEELDPKKDMHIHGLVLEIKDKNSLVQRWQGYEDGKETHATVLHLQRKE